MTKTSIKYLFELNVSDSHKFSYFKALKMTDKKHNLRSNFLPISVTFAFLAPSCLKATVCLPVEDRWQTRCLPLGASFLLAGLPFFWGLQDWWSI